MHIHWDPEGARDRTIFLAILTLGPAGAGCPPRADAQPPIDALVSHSEDPLEGIRPCCFAYLDYLTTVTLGPRGSEL